MKGGRYLRGPATYGKSKGTTRERLREPWLKAIRQGPGKSRTIHITKLVGKDFHRPYIPIPIWSLDSQYPILGESSKYPNDPTVLKSSVRVPGIYASGIT